MIYTNNYEIIFIKCFFFTLKLNSMLTLCNKMLDYCDINFEDENGKIACAFSNCYLEKVKIKKTNPDQVLVSL